MLVPHIDMNKDGFVSAKELQIWVRDKYTSILDSDDVDYKFRELDSYYDNRITWQEYTARHYGFNDNGN